MTPPVPAGAAFPEAEGIADAAAPAAVESSDESTTAVFAASPVSAPGLDELHLERIGFDSYCITARDQPVGFVEVVGRVFVVYQGSRPDHAVEVAQVLDLPSALRGLAAAL